MEKLRQFSSEVPSPIGMDRVQMNNRIDANSLEFQIAAVRGQLEAITGMLNTYPVSHIYLLDYGSRLNYTTQTGHLTWCNRHLLHEVVLLIADDIDVRGTIILQGGESRPVEEKDVIHAYQGKGKPALPLVKLNIDDPFRIEGARIVGHTFGPEGIKIGAENNHYVAFFPTGLGLP